MVPPTTIPGVNVKVPFGGKIRDEMFVQAFFCENYEIKLKTWYPNDYVQGTHLRLIDLNPLLVQAVGRTIRRTLHVQITKSAMLSSLCPLGIKHQVRKVCAIMLNVERASKMATLTSRERSRNDGRIVPCTSER